jgi:hypothetical protein
MSKLTYRQLTPGEEDPLAIKANGLDYTIHPCGSDTWCLIKHPYRLIEFNGTYQEIEAYLNRIENLKVFL